MKPQALTHTSTPLERRHARSLGAAVADFTIRHFLLLPLGALIALVWANTRPESYFPFAHASAFVVNQIGMAFFFALVAHEVFEDIMPGGALHTWRRWTLPLVGAIGGLAGSVLVFLAYVRWNPAPGLADAWPVAAAIDLAFGYFVIKSIFHRRGAVGFLLVAAVATDLIALLVVVLRHPVVSIRPGGTLLMVAALGVAELLRRRRVRSFWPHLAICGTLSWFALYLDGLHPAVALVPIVPFMPRGHHNLDAFLEPDAAHDRPTHFEHAWTYPVHVILFFFGLVNAGVLLGYHEVADVAVVAAAFAGRPIGMLLAMGAAVALGLHLPARLRWRDLAVIAVATTTGFTFSLFFAVAIFPVGAFLSDLKIGALWTIVGVLVTFVAARVLRVGRFGHHGYERHHGAA
jgi:NhaA family Na+:H+ antiporter